MNTIELVTCILNDGREVLATFSATLGRNYPITYANRTQAENKLKTLPAGWNITRGLGRPFYITKIKEEN